MSGMGMLAGAIYGGASAVERQSSEDLQQQRRQETAKLLMDLEEQKQARLLDKGAALQRQSNIDRMGDEADFQTNPNRVAARRTVQAGDADAANANARRGLLATAQDTELSAAQAAASDRAAKASSKTANEITLANAANPDLLKAQWATAMADPRVKSAYAASMAAAGASAAHTKLLGEQYTQLTEVGTRATDIRKLQKDLSVATDPAIRDGIQQKIGDLVGQGRNPEKFLSIAEKAQDNVAAALKVMFDPMATDEAKQSAKAAMQRATELSVKAAALGGIKLSEAAKPTEAQAHAEAQSAIKQGKPAAAINARLVELGYNPLPGAAPAAKATGMLGSATQDQRPRAPDTGLEGLSDIALRAIANDPANPRAVLAKELLAEKSAGRLADVSQMMDNADQYAQ